jgi:hypothetical protein
VPEIKQNKAAKDLTIVDAYLKNKRRNNMSVISVNGLKLIRPYFGFAQGTRPEARIDFEVNNNLSQVENIHVVSPVTEGNISPGIIVGLGQWYKDTINVRPVKKISITVYNHRGIKSANAIWISYAKGSYSTSKTYVQRYVRFIIPVCEKGRSK